MNMTTKGISFAFIAGSLLLLQSCGSSSEDSSTEDTTSAMPRVTVDTVQLKSFVHKITVQGNVETDQDIILTAEMGGLITNISVKEGMKVRKGQTIATVDASVLSSNIQEVKTQLDYARYMLEKQEELFKRGVGSEFDLETAKNQVKSLESKMASLSTQRGKANIKAPFNGVIDQVFARNGQMAGPQSPLVRLVNNKEVDIVASLSEKHLAKIAIGTPIEVSFPNYKDTSIILAVSNVGNYIEPTNRTFRIMANIKNNTMLLPNMLANVRITDMDVAEGFVIPSKSIQKDQDNNDFVYTVLENDSTYSALKVNIEVIEKYEGEALIKENELIKADMLIVVQGAKAITGEGEIKILNKK